MRDSNLRGKRKNNNVDQTNHKATPADFWERYLEGTEAPQFPVLPSATHQVQARANRDHVLREVQWQNGEIESFTVVCAAWAILLALYTGCCDTLFGITVTESERPSKKRASRRVLTVSPLRVVIDWEESVDHMLARVQRVSQELSSAAKCPRHIQRIASSSDGGVGHMFQSLLTATSTFHRDSIDGYALQLSFEAVDDTIHLHARYDESIVSSTGAERMLQQLGFMVRNIASAGHARRKLRQLAGAGPEDLRRIWAWNAKKPETNDICVHEIIAGTIRKQPGAPSVCAWDGDLTYRALDELSSSLACKLLLAGVKPDMVVPLCFTKSRWTVVAMLGVMKAGAASVLLDVTQPLERLKSIVQQTQAPILVCTSLSVDLAQELDLPTTLVLDQPETWTCADSGKLGSPSPRPNVRPNHLLYVAFTSGSTGTPKGCMITHSNFASAAAHQIPRLRFGPSSRVADFTSYAFDVCWSNALFTLIAGGCICIPSENDRKGNLVEAMQRMRVNYADLTTSVAAAVLAPDSNIRLDTLVIGGEVVNVQHLACGEMAENLIVAYGPAECCINSTILDTHRERFRPKSIGRGCGSTTWIISTLSREPAPIGTVGELWIEGPSVGRGYLCDPVKTAAAFTEAPKWLINGAPGELNGRTGRLYRTGDLVRYADDGSLIFVGRNDTQLKLNGQRLELEEVESHVRDVLNAGEKVHVAAEVLSPYGDDRQILAAFIAPAQILDRVEACERIRSRLPELKATLSQRLPSYMVPSLLLPIAELPLTATGKRDRRRLREEGCLRHTELFESSPIKVAELPLTSMEHTIACIWSRILRIPVKDIKPSHTVTALGGDSIRMMSLAAAIKKSCGVQMPVTTLAQDSMDLRHLATTIESLQRGSLLEVPRQMAERLEGLLSRLPSILSEASVRQPASLQRPATVFLTGATGFLGTHVLRTLLLSPAVGIVVVLVRGDSDVAGMNRITRIAKRTRWWNEDLRARIEVWTGDLSKARLGLSLARWRRLCGRGGDAGIDAVVHNGAVVHWTASYEALEAVNVFSTLELIRAAVRSAHVQRFVYISGGQASVAANVTAADMDGSTGYDQTKFMSQSLVLAAAASSSAASRIFSVVRPAFIIGNKIHGVANADDFLWRLVWAAVRLGSYPLARADSWLQMSDVDYVSGAVLTQLMTDELDQDVHLWRSISTQAFWEAVQRRLATPLRPLSWSAWRARMQQDMERQKEQHPLWPVQDFLEDLARGGPGRGTEDEQTVRELCLTVEKNVEHLASIFTAHDADCRSRLANDADVTRGGGRRVWVDAARG